MQENLQPKDEPRMVNYISDCHEAALTDVKDVEGYKVGVTAKMGICTQCGFPAWACDPKMLKPLSLERVIESVNGKGQS